jgi:predicted ATPase
MDNFTSWYRNLSQDQGMAFTLTRKFQDVLPGFDYFRFREAGERHRELFAYFKDSDRAPSQAYRFTELSDGQRALFVLYTLIHVMRTKRGILFIDEPENFLALPEIQPWLIELYDLCLQGEGQSLIISHHPELINYLLASPVGFWFERPSNSSVRVRPIVPNGVEGLRVSEIIARGWLLE